MIQTKHIAAALFFAALGVPAYAWQAPPPPIANQPAPKCKPNSKKQECKDAAAPAPADTAKPKPLNEQFPFPVEASQHGANPDGTPSTPPAATAKPTGNNMPEMPTGTVPDPPAESMKPMKLPPNGIGGVPQDDSGAPLPPGTSSSTSDRDAFSSSRHQDDPDADVAPTTASPNAPVKSSPLKDLGSSGDFSAAHAKLEATRVADDIKVGKFYLDDGNAQGAYLRFKDAVDHDAEDPDARFYLAQAADRLKKRDEAILNYRQTIQLDPGGDHEKAARSALKSLGATP